SAVLLVTAISHFSPDGPVTLVVVEPHAAAAPAVASHAARKTIRPRTRRARIFDPEGRMEITPAQLPPWRDVRCNLRSSRQRASERWPIGTVASRELEGEVPPCEPVASLAGRVDEQLDRPAALGVRHRIDVNAAPVIEMHVERPLAGVAVHGFGTRHHFGRR